jgi:hypothetical protein
MNAISLYSSRYMRLKPLQPTCNKPTSIPTAKWIVYVNTNVGFMPLGRRAFMWATFLHGSWTTGTGWDGMQHSILGKPFFPNKCHYRRTSKKRHPGGMATRTCAAPLHASDPWAHHHCRCSTPRRASRRRSLRYVRRILLFLNVQLRTHLPFPTLNGRRTTSLIHLPLTLVKLYPRPHKLRVRRQWGSTI